MAAAPAAPGAEPQGGAPPAPFRRRRSTRPGGKLRLSRDRVRMSLFLLVILTISRVHTHWPVTNKARPLLLVTAVALAFAFANPRLLATGGILRTWPAKVIAGLTVLVCLSIPFGISTGNSGLMVIETFSKTILLTYLLIAATRTVRDLYTLMWSYIISSGILAFFALFVFKLQKYDGSSVTHQRLSNLYTWDANDVVLVILIGLVLALLVLQVAKDATRRLFLILTVIGIGATAARSGSRGGFLGLVAVGLGLLLLTRGVALSRKVLVIGVAVAGMLIWAPEGYWRQMQTITDTKNDYNYTSIDGRKKIAKRGWGYMRERPLFGVGIANFQKAECTISDKARNAPPGHGVRCSAPHNSFVQAGAETGVLGLVLWSSILFGGIVSLRRAGKRLPTRFRRGTDEQKFLFYACQYLPVALIGFAVSAYFLTFAWMEPYYILAAFVAGTLSLAEAERRKHLARRRSLLIARRRQQRARALAGTPSALASAAPQRAA